MIYFIITTSLIKHNFESRKQEYMVGITNFISLVKNIPNSSTIIVENNGNSETFLDSFNDNNVKIHYTNNNLLPTRNKGIKELKDVLDVIQSFDIQDYDFVVKMTGRYILQDDSSFLQLIQNYNENIHCIIKYGPYFKPVNYKMKDCITGLIGMLVFYIKQINMNAKGRTSPSLSLQNRPLVGSWNDENPIEHEWANVSLLIPDKNVCLIRDKMGLNLKTVDDEIFTLI